MRNMVRKGRQSLFHFDLTAVGFTGVLLLLAWFGRPLCLGHEPLAEIELDLAYMAQPLGEERWITLLSSWLAQLQAELPAPLQAGSYSLGLQFWMTRRSPSSTLNGASNPSPPTCFRCGPEDALNPSRACHRVGRHRHFYPHR